jgi:bacillithiol biosynthesis cysteine-adding enzyme BshC
MRIEKINRKETGLFKEFQNQLVYEQEVLGDLIRAPFNQASLVEQLNLKKAQFPQEHRGVLKDVLLEQYGNDASDLTIQNIQALDNSNTFTITTGHQLSLMTGPLYFVIKILQVIKVCNELSCIHPDHKFVPVYWMASEDHDFEEINALKLFNRDIKWETEQIGGVGRFNLNGFDLYKEEIKQLFSNHPESDIHALLNIYDGVNLAKATRGLVNEMFADKGLVILDADDRRLKRLFAPIMKKELEASFASKQVEAANNKLETLGFPTQVFAREINLFYLDNNRRKRLIKSQDGFEIDGGELLSNADISSILDNEPEKLSPNVVLRPVYQECILPNLMYIGGLGEISYWTQLKGVFDQADVLYPLIKVRNSLLWMDTGTQKKMEKVSLTFSDVFSSADELKKNFLEQNESVDIDFSQLDNKAAALFDEMISSVTNADPNLDKFAKAEAARIQKTLENIKSKVVKAEKSKHDRSMKIIEDVKERLFPGGGLQERKANLFSFSADGNYKQNLGKIYEAIDPFNGDLILLIDN